MKKLFFYFFSPQRLLQKRLIAFLYPLLFSPTLFAEEIDYFSLSAVLIKNKDYARARRVLEKIAEGDRNARFYLLWGLVRLQQGKYLQAVQSFNTSIKKGQKEKLIYLYLSQAHYNLEYFQQAWQALTKAEGAIDELPGAWRLKSAVLWKLGKRVQSWNLNLQAAKKFPKDPEFVRQQILYFLELKLFIAARNKFREYVDRFHPLSGEYVFFANHFNLAEGNTGSTGLNILEQARLLFPNSDAIARELGKRYFAKGMLYASVGIFRTLAMKNTRYATETSEIFRRLNLSVQGQMFNGYIENVEDKLRGRLAFMIEEKNYEKAIALENKMRRTSFSENEDINYALAYAHSVLGNFKKAKRLLKKVTRDDLYKKVVVLRKNIYQCQNENRACL